MSDQPTDATAKPLTDFQIRTLRAIHDHGERGATGRSLAHALWPDSPAWEKTTRSRPGFQGSRGGTMPMKGARAARELNDLGLVWIEYTSHHQPFFTLSPRGEKVLARA